jgi:hypothetical protein
MKSPCPEITAWQTYRDGSITPNQRAQAEAHLASCHHCRQRLISLFDAAREGQVEPAPDSLKYRALALAPQQEKRSFFTSLRPLAPIAVAAAMVLAVGVSFIGLRERTGPAPTSDLRQSGPGAGEIKLANPPNGSQVDSVKTEFRWEDSTAGARYELTITDEKGDIVFQERNAKSPLTLDPGAMELSRRQKYYWSVTARFADGTRRESPIASFTIK